MSAFEHGYLRLSIDGTSPPIVITNLCLMSICVAIQMAIGVVGIRQLINDDKVQKHFKLLFVISLICCLLPSTSSIVSVPIYTMYSLSMNHTTWAMYLGGGGTSAFSFFYCLLLIAVLRLRFVFREFMTMSDRTYAGFKCLFATLFGSICAFWVVIVFAAVLFSNDPLRDDVVAQRTIFALNLLPISFWFLYAVGSFSAVQFFVNNMRKLVLSQSRGLDDAPQDLEAQRTEDVTFSEHQEPLVNLAAKYMLLFIIAISSDIVVAILLGLAVSEDSGVRTLFLVIDLTINMMCVYLQFAFATKQYMRCCGCIHRRWRKRVDLIAKIAIRKQTIELVANNSCEDVTSPTI